MKNRLSRRSLISKLVRTSAYIGGLGLLSSKLTHAEESATNRVATESNIEGPFFREGAPFRAKVSPPFAEGESILIQGRVLELETGKPITGAMINIWQADHKGRYDHQIPNKRQELLYRTRTLSDENGFYEFESILPGRYQTSPNVWRPRHIHYKIRRAGYRPLTTQLYFEGDPYNDKDNLIKPSLIIPLNKVDLGQGRYYLAGRFDIVLPTQS